MLGPQLQERITERVPGPPAQTLQKAFVPLPGQATAVYASSGLDHYRHSDWLGSARLSSSSPSAGYVSSLAYAPFGETYAQSTGTLDPSFTGMNPDTTGTSTTSDYDFLAREYSTQGRWVSPDPAGLAAVNTSNPQSWNRYSYVLNNPLGLTDPKGLYCYYGDTEPGSEDWFDNSMYDMISTQAECSTPDEYGNTGTWFDDVNAFDSVLVNADPLSDPSGFGQWISDWWSSFASIDGTQLSIKLNQCAAQQANKLYSMAIGNSKLANVFLGNTFAFASQLALGPTTNDRIEGAAGIAVSGPQYPAGNVATQIGAQAVGRIIVLGGTDIAPVAGSEVMLGGKQRFATMIGRYTAVAMKDTPQFASVMGTVSSVFDGKLLLDGATYLAMEGSCAIGQ